MEATKYHVDLIVKFGGSAITDKSKLETLCDDSLRKAAELISLCHKQNLTCIVVHGAGYVNIVSYFYAPLQRSGGYIALHMSIGLLICRQALSDQ